MWNSVIRPLTLCALLLLAIPALAGDPFAQSAEDAAAAAADYKQYCALCHGEDRQGYANDEAPSLRSESLMRSGYPTHLLYAVAYGRRGTPMGGYFEEIGGPMSREEIYRLLRWLHDQVGVEPIELSLEPVTGDIALGEEIYADNCAVCHGENGEGEIGPAIGNPAMLSLNTDAFLRYAIESGRDDTAMPSFANTLSSDEIDAVTAFLRTRATGWAVEKPILRAPPSIDQYIINPDSSAPEFELQDGVYVKSADLYKALQEKRRMVLLDTRVTSMWQMAHIEGSVPIPYYHDDFAGVAKDLPTDGTWIVTYCECPRAAAESVNRKLVKQGFKNTAVLWEGIQGWVSLGYPVSVGQSTVSEPTP
jgi:mono/diheme cytochrome c family protein/rhodanese-related sulfurtransferase